MPDFVTCKSLIKIIRKVGKVDLKTMKKLVLHYQSFFNRISFSQYQKILRNLHIKKIKAINSPSSKEFPYSANLNKE